MAVGLWGEYWVALVADQSTPATISQCKLPQIFHWGVYQSPRHSDNDNNNCDDQRMSIVDLLFTANCCWPIENIVAQLIGAVRSEWVKRLLCSIFCRFCNVTVTHNWRLIRRNLLTVLPKWSQTNSQHHLPTLRYRKRPFISWAIFIIHFGIERISLKRISSFERHSAPSFSFQFSILVPKVVL